MYHIIDKIVDFEWCRECENCDKLPSEDPCHECLNNPSNVHSTKPINFKQKAKKNKKKN